MSFDPDKHHRSSIRLKGYDYSQAGAYFVTVCTEGRQCLFGDVIDERMKLNEAGRMVQQTWEHLPTRFSSVTLDTFMVMPNHVHGIIAIVEAEPNRGAASSAPTLGDIIRAFKSISAIRVNRLLARSGQPLWQRNYYEHIVCDEAELDRVRQYILDNPAKWPEDKENPQSL